MFYFLDPKLINFVFLHLMGTQAMRRRESPHSLSGFLRRFVFALFGVDRIGVADYKRTKALH